RSRPSRDRASCADYPIGERRQLLGARVGDEEVVLDAETASALYIASWLDCKNHAGGDLAASGLVRVRRLLPASSAAAAGRMGRLAREADPRAPLADPSVQLGEARARLCELDRVVVDLHQPSLELPVLHREVTHDEVLRVVGPVPVRADPDLEQRRLALDHG